jgi:hypothetical protein
MCAFVQRRRDCSEAPVALSSAHTGLTATSAQSRTLDLDLVMRRCHRNRGEARVATALLALIVQTSTSESGELLVLLWPVDHACSLVARYTSVLHDACQCPCALPRPALAPWPRLAMFDSTVCIGHRRACLPCCVASPHTQHHSVTHSSR